MEEMAKRAQDDYDRRMAAAAGALMGGQIGRVPTSAQRPTLADPVKVCSRCYPACEHWTEPADPAARSMGTGEAG